MVLVLFCFVIRGLVVQNEGINYPTALKVPSFIKKAIIFYFICQFAYNSINKGV